ncbi:MAG: hypothetical protein EAZ16_05480 [Sphingobacteriales bacterium]|jgi:uncharacterized Fe-S cluster protein YjdI|nr:MAG: hypothetical protein EAZ16_05480 [Sphingobacteriales bacterium]
MSQTTMKYTKNDVTVIWKPDVCIHSAVCVKGLPGVFNPQRRPWIDMEQADTAAIIEQVRKCPSGAISYVLSNATEATAPAATANTTINVLPNGPFIINSECLIKHSDGSEEIKTGKVALCRCGASQKKPYCDGSHRSNGFQG